MTCDVFLGMMQTAANEGEDGEEETKGDGGPSVCALACLWNTRSGCLSRTDRSRAALLPLGGASFVILFKSNNSGLQVRPSRTK